MQKKMMNKWVLTAWFMLWSSMLSVAFGQTYGAPYRGTMSSHHVVYSTVTPSASPAYQFQSTSAFSSGVGSSYAPQISEPFAASPEKIGKRRSFGDPDDDDDYGIGILPNPQPIGEPLVLTVMAGLYIVYIYKRKKYRNR